MKKLFKILNPENRGMISIDAGTKYTGITLWHGNVRIKTDLLVNKEKRRAMIPLSSAKLILSYINNKIDISESAIPFKLSLIILEDFAYNQGGFFNTDQAEIAGIIKHYCVVKNINYTSIPPNTVKLHITGNGRSNKKEVAKELKNIGILCGTSHEYDSIGIGMTYNRIWDKATEAMYRRSILF